MNALKRIAFVCALFLSSYSHAEICVTFIDFMGVESLIDPRTGVSCVSGDPDDIRVLNNGYVTGLLGAARAQVEQQRIHDEIFRRYQARRRNSGGGFQGGGFQGGGFQGGGFGYGPNQGSNPLS